MTDLEIEKLNKVRSDVGRPEEYLLGTTLSSQSNRVVFKYLTPSFLRFLETAFCDIEETSYLWILLGI